jgi:hypothetical protein
VRVAFPLRAHAAAMSHQQAPEAPILAYLALLVALGMMLVA